MERALRDRTEALEAADRLKNAFLSNVSYEIRTPLTSILGFAETLDLGLVGELSPKQREYVLDIKRSSEELKAIIDAIIDLSAIDAGAMELKLAKLDVATVLQAVAEKLSPAMIRRDQTLSIELAEDSLAFVGDAMRVEQVIANLLSNAIGFSARGSQIRMGARRSASMSRSGSRIRAAASTRNSRKRPSSDFSPSPCRAATAGLGLAWPSSRASPNSTAAMFRLFPSLTAAPRVCRFPVDGPARQIPQEQPGERVSPQRVA